MGDISTVRTTLATAVSALEGWKESTFAPELFGRDADHMLHRGFAVAVPATEIHARDGRQRVSEGLLVTSPVNVLWAYRLRGDAQREDYAAALDAEQQLVGAAMKIQTMHVQFQRMVRAARPEGWVLGTITFSVLHRYALP